MLSCKKGKEGGLGSFWAISKQSGGLTPVKRLAITTNVGRVVGKRDRRVCKNMKTAAYNTGYAMPRRFLKEGGVLTPVRGKKRRNSLRNRGGKGRLFGRNSAPATFGPGPFLKGEGGRDPKGCRNLNSSKSCNQKSLCFTPS